MKKTKDIEVFCTMPVLETTDMSLEGKGVNFLAILQALQFAIKNREKFEDEETKCDLCWDLINYSQEYISEMIESAIEHGKKHAN